MKTEFAAYTDSDAVTVFTPSARATAESPTAGVRASGSYLADIVSAASVDVVSTASSRWTEVRHAATLDAAYRSGNALVSANGAVSTEPDYFSATGGGRLALDLSEKTVTGAFAYAYGHDTAGKTGTPFSVYSQDLARHVFSGGAELVLDRSTTAYVGLDAIVEHGDQKKPYRMLPLFDARVAESVPAGASLALVNELRLPGRVTEHTPENRGRFAASFRLARRYARSTLVVSERAYADDWGLLASTSDARFYPELSRYFTLLFHARAHVQTGVDFWSRAYVGRAGTDGFVTVPQYRTGDRELGPLLSGTAGAGVRIGFGSPGASALGVSLQGDVTATRFLDALYVRERLAAIGIVQVEAEL